MANKTAPYKQEQILTALEEWWDDTTRLDGKQFTTVDDMFESYTDRQLTDGFYQRIVSRSDFQRCLYKIGVRRLGDGAETRYVRMPTWRPSDNMVMRFPLYVEN